MVNAWKVTAIILIIFSSTLLIGIFIEGFNNPKVNTQCSEYGENNVKVCAIRCFQQDLDDSYLVGELGDIPECKCAGVLNDR